MLVKTFKAPTATDALALVRESLGPDAVVLETRRSATGVELLAAAERPRAVARPLDGPAVPADTLHPAADRLRATLESAGFSCALAVRIAAAAEADPGPAAIADPSAALARARELISLIVPTDVLPETDTPSVLAFVGAPGAGKTTTLAKLAARTRLEGTRALVIATADTERLGGAEQAEAWARLLDARYHVIRSAADLDAARADTPEGGLLLVDTPGVAAGDRRGIDRLTDLLGPLEPWEIELTLAADREECALAETVRRFRPVRPGALAATRLDETRRRGALVGLVAKSGLPVRHLASGVAIPDDLACADASRIAAWSLRDVSSEAPS